MFKSGDLARVTQKAVYKTSANFLTNYSWYKLIGKVILITDLSDAFSQGYLNANKITHYYEYDPIADNINIIPDCFLEKI